MSNEAEGQEKVAGTNLTTVPEYAQTALVLNDLKQRFAGRVFESLETDAQRKAARKDIAEVRDYRTALEAERKRIKAPALERCRLIDAEAARLTTELRALEDPMKAQLDAKEAEIEAEKIRRANAEAERVKGHTDAIQRMRDFPLSLQGKPSAVIEARIADFITSSVASALDRFEEYEDQASDAYIAALASAKDLLQRQRDHEAEQEQIKRDREELAKQRAENERLQREAEERREADARREREEIEASARAEQAERDRIAAQERAERERVEAEQRAAREAEEASERQRLEEEAGRQREAAAELERQKREHAAQMERDRIAKLGLMEAVKAVVEYVEKGNSDVPRCILDLVEVWHALPAGQKVVKRGAKA